MVDTQKVIYECPGSCGELFQGMIDGKSLHVTCPIDKHSSASAVSTTASDVLISPPLKKVSSAVADFMSIKKLSGGVQLNISSELPIGKGMASSTADIAAALAAVSDQMGIYLTPKEIGAIAKKIEPTDGVFFDGVAVFDHCGGDLVEVVDLIPKIEILIIDTGGQINSKDFDSGRIDYSKEELYGLEKSFEAVISGLKKEDPELIGQGATSSAMINQRYLNKPLLKEAIEFSKRIGAYGINIAHSGTVIGLLLEAGQTDRHIGSVKKIFPGLMIMKSKIISGGIKRSVYCAD